MRKRGLAAFCAAFFCISILVAPAAYAALEHRVALGDSYASGLGAGNYEPGTIGGCFRSRNSYSELDVARARAAGAQIDFTNATCSGATIETVRATQLSALTPSTSRVYLTVLGNDIDFSGYAGTCVQSDCTGAPTAATLQKIPAAEQNLEQLFDEIRQRSPQANVIVVGYGRPMTLNSTDAQPADPICAAVTPNERTSAGWVSSGVDAALQLAATKKNAKYVGPFKKFNPFQLRPVFAGHSLCEPTPWYLGLIPASDGVQAPAHPTAQWHVAVADLLAS